MVRTYISLPAGIAEMPFVKFCIYSFLGSFPWSLLLAYIGLVLGAHLDKLSPIFHSLDAVILVAVVVLIALYIWRHIRNDNKARAEAIAQEQAQQYTTPQDQMSQQWNAQNTPFSQVQQSQFDQYYQEQGQQSPQSRQFQTPPSAPQWQFPTDDSAMRR